MTWDFFTRAEQMDYVSRAIVNRVTGAIVVTGEPGMGRTTFLARVLRCADPQRDEVIVLRPAGAAPLATLRASYPRSLPERVPAQTLADAITTQAGGRRLIIAADDAHQMDDATMSVLRELAGHGVALLLVTRPLAGTRPTRPDPTALLAHLRCAHTITLLPLSVAEIAAELAGNDRGGLVAETAAEALHAAARGNPSSLRALVDGLSAQLPPGPADISAAVTKDLVSAAWAAWQAFLIDRADQLCRLALRCGARQAVAPIWAMLLLLRGQADDCLEFLASLSGPGPLPPRLAMVRALALTLGSGQPDEAGDLLFALSGGGERSELLLAYRAWLLAITGREAAVRTALANLDRTDQGTALFIHAARAVLAELADEHHESVFHLRRAIASAETSSDDFPWIRPYLHGALIDALMTSGREKEAVSSARRFHAHEPSSGWPIAVSMHTLITKHALAERLPPRRELESAART